MTDLTDQQADSADGSLRSITVVNEESGKIEQEILEEEHEMFQEEYDFASCSMGFEVFDWDQHRYEVRFVSNPLFEADATLSCDNPLFKVDADSTPDHDLGVGIDHSIWDSFSALGF